ncbi:MAG TPA: hypothetical protein VES73_06595 [Lamprocystis sp. (in: g-proteobacteria)]|nr:hypothetical protein [Lamprocystis sp. (in: g-proteobacteria)]
MPLATRKHLISLADYPASEEVAEVRHEYIAGALFAMTGASDRCHLVTRSGKSCFPSSILR